MTKPASEKSSANSQKTPPSRANALPPPPPDVLCKVLGYKTITVDWLAGDGSDRCYYRLSSPEIADTLVLMQLSGADAEALKKGGYDWIKIANLLDDFRIPVPKLIAQIPDHAALVIEDYGDRMLEGQVFGLVTQKKWEQISGLYGQCFKILSRFLLIQPNTESVWCKRCFDTERFTWELNFFIAKYFDPVVGVKLSSSDQLALKNDIAAISQFLSARSKFFVHRDFHSRNVMVKHEKAGDKLAILDFQDARLGPPSYDLVSLCFDSYVPFDAAQRLTFLKSALKAFGEDHDAATLQMLEDEWKPTLLQRQLKAIGSFGFLTLEKNKGDYLRYVVPAVATLYEQDLGDKRWPFLSKTLIEMLREHLGQSF